MSNVRRRRWTHRAGTQKPNIYQPRRGQTIGILSPQFYLAGDYRSHGSGAKMLIEIWITLSSFQLCQKKTTYSSHTRKNN